MCAQRIRIGMAAVAGEGEPKCIGARVRRSMQITATNRCTQINADHGHKQTSVRRSKQITATNKRVYADQSRSRPQTNEYTQINADHGHKRVYADQCRSRPQTGVRRSKPQQHKQKCFERKVRSQEGALCFVRTAHPDRDGGGGEGGGAQMYWARVAPLENI